MFSKRESGFVFAVLALLVFSGFFVSAEYFGPQHTQIINSFSKPDGENYFEFTLPNSMNISNLTIIASIPPAGTACKVNISVYSVDSSNPVYLNLNGTIISARSPAYNTSLFVFSPTSGIKIPPMEVKRIIINSTSACPLVGNRINNAFVITAVGQYNLPLINVSLLPSAIVANNSSIIVPLTVPSTMELVQVDLNFSFVSALTASCPVNVSIRSSQKSVVIGTVDIGALAGNNQKSYLVSSPFNNAEVVLDTSVFVGTGASRVRCYKDKLNLTGVVVRGRVTTTAPAAPACTSFEYSDWDECSDGSQTRDIVSRSPADCTGGDPILTQSCGLGTCFTRCAQNGTLGAVAPYFTNSLASCVYGKNCENILIQRSSAMNIIWQYNYSDGSSESICSCNETSLIDNHITYIPSAVGVYSLPVFISDNNQKVLSKVGLYVLGVNGNNKTATVNKVINVEYECNNYCNGAGLKQAVFSINSDQTNRYRICEKRAAPNNNCFNWSSEVYTCSPGEKFDLFLNTCKFSQTNDCNGQRFFCSEYPLFSNAEKQFNAENLPVNCSLSTQNCFRCNSGFNYNPAHGSYGACVKDGCINNCTSSGGVCSIGSPSGNNLGSNSNYTCCTDESCYMCAANSHVYNNTCVLDVCEGLKPLDGAANVTFGANNTKSSSVFMNWTYVSGPVGACQWNCSVGYQLNVSDNRSCKPRETINCSILGGICSNVTSLINAQVDNYGNCSAVNDKCYICDSNYRKDGNSCVLRSCADDGKVNNGLGCVQNMSCSDGCILENKNGVANCVRFGFKLVFNGTKKYCDLQSLAFKNTLANNQVCNSHSECNSNFCFKNATSSYCMDLTTVGGIQDTIIKFVCWFKTIGQGEASYNSCKANKAAAYLQ